MGRAAVAGFRGNLKHGESPAVMPSIKRVIPDIYELLKRKDGWMTDELSSAHAHSLSLRLQEQFTENKKPYLRMSMLGDRCPKALWHAIHTPELAEPLPPWVINKFCYGHMVEAWAITLARAAGHTVEGEQDVLSVDGVYGHRDLVLDGYVVDVKSAGGMSYGKFKDGSIATNDGFGYLEQLDAYLSGSLDDSRVKDTSKGYLWAVNKELGHMCLYEHKHRPEHIRQRIRDYREIVSLDAPPPCECGTRKSGESGNIELDVRASYSDFKYTCFPNLRCFLYSKGPVYLTKVVKYPKYKGQPLVEVDKYGRIVF
jgi:hypothetical protein